MQGLSNEDFYPLLRRWYQAWNDHNLDGVMTLFHDDIVFVNWDGAMVKGKKSLQRAWTPWFENHKGFSFIENETFIDVDQQKVLFGWELIWPSRIGNGDKTEKRYGVDILHFHQGKILKKNTFSKTFINIDGKRIILKPDVARMNPQP